MSLIYWLIALIKYLFLKLKNHIKKTYYSRKPLAPPKQFRNNKKPDWVIKELIKLKALMPNAGCRLIAHTFNRRFSDRKKMTVSKTYVSCTLKNHQYEIKIVKRKLKHKRPRALKLNKIWAMDLTFLRTKDDTQSTVLGIIEHQSRLSISLTELKTKSSINILKVLISAIELFDKPESIRTDNEIVFTSRLVKFAFWLLGIKHQKSDKGCPWQNGKIERFFGTFKSKLRCLPIDYETSITKLLIEYRCWYNHLRPHDYLDGQTPSEVFSQKSKSLKQPRLFQFWDGALVGYYYPP